MHINLPSIYIGSITLACQGIEPHGILKVHTRDDILIDIIRRQVGNKIMIARGVLAADSLQSIFRLHGLRFGCSIHRIHIRAIDNPGTLSLHGLNVGPHLLRHISATRNDKGLIAGSGGCLDSTIHHLAAHQQTFGDVVTIETCLVNIEDGLDELRS